MSKSLTQFAYAAGLDLNVMDSGGAFSAQQYLDILVKANLILDNWSSDQIQVPYASVDIFAVNASQRLYTVGFSQNWNYLVPPRKFVSAAHELATGGQMATMPIEVVGAARWSSLPDRDATAGFIKYLFYDRGAFGSTIARARVAPAPYAAGSIEITSWGAFASFPDVSTAVTFPPGYELPFQLELAIQIAPMFDTQPSQNLMDRHATAMNTLRKLNADLWGVESLAPESAAVKATE